MDVTFAVERYCRGVYNKQRCQVNIAAADTICPQCGYTTPRRDFTVTISRLWPLAAQFFRLSKQFHERSKDPDLDRFDYEAICFASVALFQMGCAARDGKPLRLR